MSGLELRPLRLDDEVSFLAANRSMAAEHFPFGIGYCAGGAWPDYVHRLEAWRVGSGLPDGWVPGSFLVAECAGEVVGRSAIRHSLNEFLAREGGHIGFCVLPQHRRRGFATEILDQSVMIAGALGIERVLVTCDDDNVASARVIERCGGVFESLVDSAEDQVPVRRYWIG